jgi:hypothetical protein
MEWPVTTAVHLSPNTDISSEKYQPVRAVKGNMLEPLKEIICLL